MSDSKNKTGKGKIRGAKKNENMKNTKKNENTETKAKTAKKKKKIQENIYINKKTTRYQRNNLEEQQAHKNTTGERFFFVTCGNRVFLLENHNPCAVLRNCTSLRFETWLTKRGTAAAAN